VTADRPGIRLAVHGELHTRLQRTAQQLWHAAAGVEDAPDAGAAVLLRATIEAAGDACAEASDVWVYDPVAAVRHVYAAHVLLRTNERAYHEVAGATRATTVAEIEHAYVASREVVEELYLAIR
jgi:hypothetical protein